MNKGQFQIVKIFIFLVIVTLIVVYWNFVSWIFNYRVVNGLIYDFLNPYEKSSIIVSADTIQINNPVNPVLKSSTADKFPYSEKNNVLEIPKLRVVAPVVISQTTDVKVLEEDLNEGVVYYPGSVLPAENGQIVILGHSAPPNWPHIKYDYVFSDISTLNPGDEVLLYFNNTQYTYKVIGKNIIRVGQDVESSQLNGGNNVLTLISCWPPGKNYKRIVVYAELSVVD